MNRPSRCLLLLPLFAYACASPDQQRWQDDQEWRRILRHRLTTLLPPAQPSSPATGPRQATVPQGPTLRPFERAAGPAGREVTLRVGGGTHALRLPGTRLDDRTEVVTAQLRITPTTTGAGLLLGGFLTDDDQFEHTTISNGAEPVRAAARTFGFDLFPFQQFDLVRDEQWILPVRVGAFVDWTRVDHTAGDLERSWIGFGSRLQFEPEWVLARGDRTAVSLFGQLGADYGGSWFRDDFVNGEDDGLSDRWGGEAGGGLRLRLGRFVGEFGYRFGYRDLGDLDGGLLGDVGKVEERTHTLFLGLGGRF